MKGAFGFLQQIGRSLMLPVSVLPIAGILLGIGSAKFSFLPPLFSQVMAQAGGSIFSNLSLFFAIGVALGFAAYDGVAAVAACVGYFVLLATMGVAGEAMHLKLATLSGIKTLETGVFGGILVGLMAGLLFKRFYRIELPPYLGFFAGKRFVPIVTGLGALVMGLVMSLIWPPIQAQIDVVSNFVANEQPALSVTIYGIVERALIPFGLHHIWNNPFFFQIGEYAKDGQVYHGDITRFLQGDKTAGILGGAYLFKMWGLPAAAIAMWHCARPERRQEVGGIMVSAAFTSFLTGITEPIEFSFLFLAPMLYGLHALLAGSAFFVMYSLGGHLGTTFSHGLIDYVVLFPQAVKPWLVLVLGPIYALIYYLVFRVAITVLDLKTPGRESEVAEATLEGAGGLAGAVLAALGGASNLSVLDACITRLRVTVVDMAKVDKEGLKNLGAAGVMVVGNSLQAIYGTRSENLKGDIEALIASGGKSLAAPAVGPTPIEPVAATLPPLPDEQVEKIHQALGGRDNLLEVQAVAHTRLRIRLRQLDSLNETSLYQLGVRAVHPVGEGVVHLVVGQESSRWSQSLEVK